MENMFSTPFKSDIAETELAEKSSKNANTAINLISPESRDEGNIKF
jgi:hypothetical protein